MKGDRMKKSRLLLLFFVIGIVLVSCDANLNPFTDTTWIHTSSYISNNITWQTKKTLQLTATEAVLAIEDMPSEGELFSLSKTGTYTYTADTISINLGDEVLNGTVSDTIITVVSGEKTQVFLKQ